MSCCLGGLGLLYGLPSLAFFGHSCMLILSITPAGESLKINVLSPYLESSGSNFSHGVNFAVAGAATEPNATFPLSTQVLQFHHFKNRTGDLRARGTCSVIVFVRSCMKQGWLDQIRDMICMLPNSIWV